MSKVALITGITGQDGSYLAEFLLEKAYGPHGIKRQSSSLNTERINHIYEDPHIDNRRFILHYGDLTDSTNLIRITQQVRPDDLYNPAAQSHVAVSFKKPEYTANADALGTQRLLEAIRIIGLEKKAPLLPGLQFRALWPGAGNAAEGNHVFLPAQSLRRRQGRRHSGRQHLPRRIHLPEHRDRSQCHSRCSLGWSATNAFRWFFL